VQYKNVVIDMMLYKDYYYCCTTAAGNIQNKTVKTFL